MLERLLQSALTNVSLSALPDCFSWAGAYAFHLLDVVAHLDPSPPMVEAITQYLGWAAEQVEQTITLPIEIALQGMPGLTGIRSLSIFGLHDITVYFAFGTDYFRDRQEVLNRLQLTALPQNVQPTISLWTPIAEMYRYEVVGDGKSLTDLKAISGSTTATVWWKASCCFSAENARLWRWSGGYSFGRNPAGVRHSLCLWGTFPDGGHRRAHGTSGLAVHVLPHGDPRRFDQPGFAGRGRFGDHRRLRADHSRKHFLALVPQAHKCGTKD